MIDIPSVVGVKTLNETALCTLYCKALVELWCHELVESL